MQLTIISKAPSATQPGVTPDLSALARYLADGCAVTLITDQHEPHPGLNIRQVKFPRASRLHIAAFSAFALHELGRLPTPDVLVTSSDCPILPLANLVLHHGGRRKARLVHVATRIEPEATVAIAPRISPTQHIFARSVTSANLRYADAVIAVGDDVHELLLGNYLHCFAHKRPCAVSPWAQAPAAVPDCSCGSGSAPVTEFRVMHHGGYGAGHEIATLAQAAELTSTDRSISWILAGNDLTPDRLRRGRNGKTPTNVRHLRTDGRSMQQLLEMADLHIFSQTARLAGAAAVSQLPWALAGGYPCVWIGPDYSRTTELLTRHNAAAIVPSGKGEILARTVWQLRDSAVQRSVLARAGRLLFDRTMSPEIVFPQLRRILSELA